MKNSGEPAATRAGAERSAGITGAHEPLWKNGGLKEDQEKERVIEFKTRS